MCNIIWYTTPHHIMPHHTTSHHATPRHVMSHHTSPQHSTPHNVMQLHATPRHTTSRYITSHHTTPHHGTPCHTTPHHTTPHHTTPRHATPRHNMRQMFQFRSWHHWQLNPINNCIARWFIHTVHENWHCQHLLYFYLCVDTLCMIHIGNYAICITHYFNVIESSTTNSGADCVGTASCLLCSLREVCACCRFTGEWGSKRTWMTRHNQAMLHCA